MNYVKGQDVIARDIDGTPHQMKVWAESNTSVFVASKEL